MPFPKPQIKISGKSGEAKIPKPTVATPATTLAVEERFKKLQHREHVLLRPDTYIGTIEPVEEELWLYDQSTSVMVKGLASYNPGLYKLFDEILVNAIDQYTRVNRQIELSDLIRAKKIPPSPEVDLDKTYRPVKNIRVDFDPGNGSISVENDGTGIDVVIHKDEKIYVPELIFGHLLTGENFEDQAKQTNTDKIWGGRNGYGAKLVNIFSTRFEVETIDESRKLRFHQVFTDNMKHRTVPTVERYTKVPFTKIVFFPDLSRFKSGTSFFTGTGSGIGSGSGAGDRTIDLMKRRVIDTAGWLGAAVNVYLNGQKIAINSFEKYMNVYLPPRGEFKRVFLKVSDRWEVGACLSQDQKFEQVSFVNGIATLRGGKHVDYLVNQITRKMLAQVTKVSKNSTLKSQHIKDNLWIFVKAIIPDPTFDTQTKENMTLAISKFGNQSKCELSDDFVAKIAKTGILDRAKQLNVFKDNLELTKTDAGKSARCNVPKLADAPNAGTYLSELATLVITEGDSAQTFAQTGIASLPTEDRRNWGNWPIRGKFLNVREAKASQLANNAELINLKKILGLQQNVDYTESKANLRYGGLMILSDSDLDGIHIRGLIINFIHYFWPSLLRRNDFLKMMMTPIVRVWKNINKSRVADPASVINFWTEIEYRKWKVQNETLPGFKSWQIKYFKGLGTSTEPVAREIFRMMKLVEPQWVSFLTPENRAREAEYQSGRKYPTPKIVIAPKIEDNPADILPELEVDLTTPDARLKDYEDSSGSSPGKLKTPSPKIKSGASSPGSGKTPGVGVGAVQKPVWDPNDDAITLAFAKTRADDRKVWIGQHLPDQQHEFNPKQSYREFIDYELREFSVADCRRSIPSICDGLKPSQRKIMYTALRFHKKEIKVSQLAGSVANKSAYHHGEASLFDAIIKLAQNYVGSNNLNLLHPEGQFGTRRINGKDAASPRYLFTYVPEIVKILFDQRDEALYTFLDDDGFMVEPQWYLPILPIILINGASGIGTGYSTDIPGFNPRDILDNLRRLLDNQPVMSMTPWYRGFEGTIVPNPERKGSFICRGAWRKLSADRIEITEIPVNLCYDSYKEFLEGLLDQKTSTKSKSKAEGDSSRETPTKRREKNLVSLIRSIDTSVKGTTFFRPQIQFVKDGLTKLETELGGVEKAFKLEANLNLTNMHMYDADEQIRKYSGPEAILTEFYHLRLEFYKKRQAYMLSDLDYDFRRASAKLRFVLEVIADEIHIHKQKRQAIIDQLVLREYPKFSTNKSKVVTEDVETQDETNAEATGESEANAETDVKTDETNRDNYNYLLHMRIESFSQETIEKLTRERDHSAEQLQWLKSQTPGGLWRIDLDKFEQALPAFEAEWVELKQEEARADSAESKKKKVGKVPPPKKQTVRKVI